MRPVARGLALAAMLLGLAACGVPETVSGGSWQGPTATPSGSEYSPAKAMRHDVNGWAVVRCISTAEYRAVNCVALAEYPFGYGLADAALRLTPNITTQHTEESGEPLPKPGDAIILPARFCQPGEDAKCEALQPVLQVVIARAKSADRLAKTGRCDEARAEAQTAEQPRLVAFVDGLCGHRP